ncbi:MAG: hypothetical protein WA688_06055 [Thermoplasmata archaeon]
MAADRRTRRLIVDPSLGQRTLDPAPLVPEPPVELDPSEVLEPPPAQHAAGRLEERQKRWFRVREAVMETAEKAARPAAKSMENQTVDPKG